MKLARTILLLGLIITTGLMGFFYFFEPNESLQNLIDIGNNEKITVDPKLPVRLVIPSIGIDTPIKPAGLTQNGNVEVPDGPHETVWFEHGARPGEIGSAVITGHYGPWRSGEASVFDNLSQLNKGDTVRVRDASGKIFTFSVTDTKIYNADETVPEIFNKNDGTYLNLITCNGEWLENEQTYTRRLVVFTALVE